MIHNSNTNTDRSLTNEGAVLESVPIEKIEQYLNSKYNFRRNLVTGRIEFKLQSEAQFKTITENSLNSLWRELTKARRPCSTNTLFNLLKSDFSPEYDPFIEYVNSLPEWDGETDYIGRLASTATTNNQEFWEYCFRKWIVAMVASWVTPEVVNHTALVFSGGQGIGKTTWIDNLMPPSLKTYYFSGTINPNDKDTLSHLVECAIINLDELENLNKSEIGTLKEVITKSVIRYRRPYGIDNEVFTRRASFAGSVNAKQFLNDATGSRRFLCFEVTSFEKDHNIDINLVYSQAIALYNSRFQFWFNQEDIAMVERNNAQYQQTSLEAELVLQYFEPADQNDPGCEFLSATEIATIFRNDFKIPMDNGKINRLGKAMHQLGYNQVKRRGLAKYCLKRKTDANSQAVVLSISA